MSYVLQSQLLISGNLQDLIKILSWIHQEEITLHCEMANRFGEQPVPAEVRTEKVASIKEKIIPSKPVVTHITTKNHVGYSKRGDLMKVNCWNCKTEFLTRNRHKKYCSPHCSAQAWNRSRYPRPDAIPKPAAKPKQCPECKGSFIPAKSNQEYCSHTCYNKALKQRKKITFDHVCKNCGKQTYGKHGWPVSFCSITCRRVFLDPSLKADKLKVQEFTIPESLPLGPLNEHDQSLKEKLDHIRKTCPAPSGPPIIHREF